MVSVPASFVHAKGENAQVLTPSSSSTLPEGVPSCYSQGERARERDGTRRQRGEWRSVNSDREREREDVRGSQQSSKIRVQSS
jgi:hypothetical protein